MLNDYGYPEKVYRIESGLTKYEQNTWATRSVYADAETSTLKWTVTPNNFEEENQEFLYNIIPVDEEINTIYRLEIADENLGKVYIIKLLDQDQFAGAHDDATNNFLVTPQPVAYWINNLAACNFEVKTATNNRYWHTEGHAEGNGYGGRLVNWNCGNNLNTASSWTFINMGEMEETAIEELVIEGDEVVSVSYFTPAGTAIPAPAKLPLFGGAFLDFKSLFGRTQRCQIGNQNNQYQDSQNTVDYEQCFFHLSLPFWLTAGTTFPSKPMTRSVPLNPTRVVTLEELSSLSTRAVMLP